MNTHPTFARNDAAGPEVFTSTVYRSTTLTSVTLATLALAVGEAWASSKENLTSSAVSSFPSWNLMPLRRKKRQVVGSGFSQRSATSGVCVKPGPRKSTS